MNPLPPTRIKKAIYWNFVQQFSKQGIRFLIGLWLARILDPRDFGLIAMVAVFSALSEKLIGMGFASSLVQKNSVDDADCSTIFFTNLGIAFLAYGLLYTIAPQVAHFYDEASLEGILRVVCLALIIRATFTVQAILFTIRLDFKTPLLIGTIAELIAGVVSISMAYAGFHVWALVGFSLSRSITQFFLYKALSPWKPKFLYSFASLRNHLKFGTKITLISSIEVTFNHLHSIAIGRFFDPVTLGLFARAKSLQSFASANTIEPVSRVIYPGLARVKNDRKKLTQIFDKSLELTVFLILPLMTGLAFSADTFILTILGSKWIDAAPYLQLMCIIGMIIPIRNQCSNLLKTLNHLNHIIVTQTACRILSIIAIFITYRAGIKAMIFGEIIVTAILGISFIAVASWALSTRLWNHFLPMIPYVIGSLVIASGLSYIPLEKIQFPFLRLLMSVAISLVGYGLTCYVFRARIFLELVGTLISQLKKFQR